MMRFPTRPLPLLLILLGLLLVWPSAAFAGTAPKSLAYVLQADSFASSKPLAIRRLAASKRDWLVLDVGYSSTRLWTRNDLAAIRRAQPGRKILAYLSIGEAEDYRPYWQTDWTTTPPPWLLSENPDWPGNFKVKYWNADWQAIMLGAVDTAMSQGFDGVYLDIVDAFEFFEQDGSDFIDNRPNPDTGQSYRRDMVDWVKRIARRVRSHQPGALVIPQNGSQLLAHADFLNTVSGMGVEDLFTDDNQLQTPDDTNYRLSFLKKLLARKKPVLDIEYPTLNARKTLVRQRAHQKGLVWLITDRELQTLGTSGN